MTSIKKSAAPPRPRASGGGKPKRRKAKSGNGERHARVPLGLLLDVQDEIHDLDVILGGIAELRRFTHAMTAITADATAQAGHDRIGRAAREFNGKPLPPFSEHRAGGHALDAADLIDLGNAPDTIVTAVRCRLERVKELLAMVTQAKLS